MHELRGGRDGPWPTWRQILRPRLSILEGPGASDSDTPRPPPPDSVSDPGLSPALPSFTTSREHGPGADFSPVASPQPSGVGSSAAPCLSLLSVRWGRGISPAGRAHRGGCVGQGSQCSGATRPLSVPLGCSAATAEAPGALPSLLTDSQAEGRTAEVGGAWGLGWSAQGLRGRAPVLWGLRGAEKQRELGAARWGQGGEEGRGRHGAGRQWMGWPRGREKGSRTPPRKRGHKRSTSEGQAETLLGPQRGLKGSRIQGLEAKSRRWPPWSRPLA